MGQPTLITWRSWSSTVKPIVNMWSSLITQSKFTPPSNQLGYWIFPQPTKSFIPKPNQSWLLNRAWIAQPSWFDVNHFFILRQAHESHMWSWASELTSLSLGSALQPSMHVSRWIIQIWWSMLICHLKKMKKSLCHNVAQFGYLDCKK